jgi:cytochrome c-type protein NapC
MRATCHDCHIPSRYPELLWYKAVAGTKDVIGEMRGVISTEEKFAQERKRMAGQVWAEYKANDSRACRGCHLFSPEVLAKQQEMVRPIHTPVLDGRATCIDCHKGVGHVAP